MECHGILLNVNGILWDSVEYQCSSMECHWISMKFYGSALHSNGVLWNSIKFEWNSIDEISIPIAPEPVKEVGKYDISEDIFNVGIGQQVPTP